MKLRTLYHLWRHFGLRWLGFRVRHALAVRCGWLRRRLPAGAWSQRPLAAALQEPDAGQADRYVALRRRQEVAFFFRPEDRTAYARWLERLDDGSRWCDRRRDQLGAGRLVYFHDAEVEAGWPPRWHRNPFTGRVVPHQVHFAQVDDFGHGDIKVIWEPSRFAFAFELARIHWRTGDEGCGELFWQALEDWHGNNPPNTGANWKCGQEASLRAMAWCFGLWAFARSPHSTAPRRAMAAQMLAFTADRVEATLAYALSQHNNHSISEAVGLWTIGLLMPELKRAPRYRDTGRRVLEAQSRRLIYDDGAFSQYSVNYHRLMLHDYLWAIRLGDLNRQPLSAALQARVARAGRFVAALMDRSTGRVPRYGQDDGALILPLNRCGYDDHRPVVQACHYLQTGRRCLGPGPWDEDLLWLFGPEALDAPQDEAAPDDFEAPDGGCHVLRSDRGFVLARSSQFHHRPAQMDLLHVDAWWQGINVALDAGTYSYNAEGPWADIPLMTAFCHNTVTVDGQDQSQRVSRFLYLPWPRGTTRCCRSPRGHLVLLELTHDGYRRLSDPVHHHRTVVRLGREHWLVLDQLRGDASAHTYRLHWLLCDATHDWNGSGRLCLHLEPGSYQVQVVAHPEGADCELVRADPPSARGWYAPAYMRLAPALSLSAGVRAAEASFVTLLGPAPAELRYHAPHIDVAAPDLQAQLELAPEGHGEVRRVRLGGRYEDELTVEACTPC